VNQNQSSPAGNQPSHQAGNQNQPSNLGKPFATAEDYVRAAKDLEHVDTAILLDLMLAETEHLRSELKMAAEVPLDENGNFKPKSLAGLYRLGTMYSRSDMVPAHYRGRPDDCAIAAQMALRVGVDILTFLQSSYIVKGTPGIKGTLAIAMINGSGKIKGRIKFKLEGSIEVGDRQCTATAIDAENGEEVSATVTWQMVKDEGWDQPKGTQTSKWLTLPDQMFKYRSAMFLARTTFPDVLLGFYSDDELEDIHGIPASDAVTGRQPGPHSVPAGANSGTSNSGTSPNAIDRTRSQLDALLERHEDQITQPAAAPAEQPPEQAPESSKPEPSGKKAQATLGM
jgi:hypothetical protein